MQAFFVGSLVAISISALGIFLKTIIDGASWESTIRGYERFPIFLISSLASGCAATIALSDNNMSGLATITCICLFMILLLDLIVQKSNLPICKQSWESWDQWRFWPHNESPIIFSDFDQITDVEEERPRVKFPTLRRLLFTIALIIALILGVNLLGTLGMSKNRYVYLALFAMVIVMYIAHKPLFGRVLRRRKQIITNKLNHQLCLKYSRSKIVNLDDLASASSVTTLSKEDCQRTCKELKRLMTDMIKHPFSATLPSGAIHPYLKCRMLPPVAIEELASAEERKFKQKLQRFKLEYQVVSGSKRDYQEAMSHLHRMKIDQRRLDQLTARRTQLGL